ncbi:hypothetical protein [Lujinxingia vulgaris]|uniref:hypothetical protein n=1 Tax=Lujinxingia vulgaris TaxID=2600176 RepID=UPI001E425835|nr:hypothetical protein [Lujinxingia vulgaris]
MEKERNTAFYLAILAILAIAIILILKLTGPPAPDEFYKGPAPADAASSDLVEPQAE